MAGRTWHYSHNLGRNTAEHNGKTGGFGVPMDVAVAGDGILFVISRGYGYEIANFGADIACRIGKTTIDEEHIGDFARNEFTWPTSIDLALDGNVYVSDEYQNTIGFFDPDGIFEFPEFDPSGEALGRWGETGSAEGQLDGPTGLEFDLEGDLYVVDSRNDRVQKFTKDGEFLSSWGSSGAGEGQFNRPWGITTDSEGMVYVADWGNHRVQKFSPDGQYLSSFTGVAEDSLQNPSGVAVDSDGDVYVTDWGHRRVQIFEPDGEVITALYGDATELSKAGIYAINRAEDSVKLLNHYEGVVMDDLGRFGRPIGIAIDEQDRVIITDARGRLVVYVKDKDYVEPIL
jgi:DNA-binding beta-propeller fold protein YncE